MSAKWCCADLGPVAPRSSCRCNAGVPPITAKSYRGATPPRWKITLCDSSDFAWCDLPNGVSLLGTMPGQRPMTAEVQTALAELKAMNKLELARERAAHLARARPSGLLLWFKVPLRR